mmetsp:Transcript_16423/g.51443  ORF Transcript_16423/g.51443 Transcript_16423/m.51443 type:complete len:237 (-) Transcript_16423:13-723(-)
MVHTVPCVGYVVTEPDLPGKLDPTRVAAVLDRNFDALKAAGVKDPRKVYKIIKEMTPGQSFDFPDGTRLRAADCVSPARPGRVVAVCGDTADARRLAPLLRRRCDLLVHEATNAHLGDKYDAKLDPVKVAKATAYHGHSTPEMAATFARSVRASRLVLTHFSPRYSGDGLKSSMDVMRRIESQARRVLGPRSADNHDDDPVIAVWDLAVVPVHPPPHEPLQPPGLVPSKSSRRPSA